MITHVESLFRLYLLNGSFQEVQNRTFAQHRLIIIFIYRFTSILGSKKFSENTDPERQSSRLSAPTGSSHLALAWIYPKECNICLKHRVQCKNKRTEPYTIVNFDAANSIKAAAKVKNENLYVEIKDLDLIAKEFKVHKHCYQQFTHGYTKGVCNKDQPLTSKDPKYDSGKFEAVKVFVCNPVLKLGKAASMKQLHDIYQLGAGDSRYRSKLKARLQNHFMDQILILSSTTGTQSTEFVVSSCYNQECFAYDKEEAIRMAAKLLRAVSDDSRKPPDSVYMFLQKLLNPRNKASANVSRVIESLAQDIAFVVMKGKVLQRK